MEKRKNMKKILLPAVVALALIFAMTVTAMADLVPPLNDYNVKFTSKEEMVSSFKTEDMYNQFAGMQPGDYTDIAISLKNEHEKTTDWYMTNEVLKTLEDTREEAALSGGAYTYKLTYKNSRGSLTDTVFTFNDTHAADVYNGGTNRVFYVVFRGLSAFSDITVTTVVRSDTGVQFVCPLLSFPTS